MVGSVQKSETVALTDQNSPVKFFISIGASRNKKSPQYSAEEKAHKIDLEQDRKFSIRVLPAIRALLQNLHQPIRAVRHQVVEEGAPFGTFRRSKLVTQDSFVRQNLFLPRTPWATGTGLV